MWAALPSLALSHRFGGVTSRTTPDIPVRLQARRNLGDRKDLPLRDRTLPGAHGKVHIKSAPNVRC